MYNYHFNRIKKFIIDTIIKIIYNIRNDLFSYLLICIMFISILSEEAAMSTDQFNRQMGQSVGAKLRAARQAKRYTQSKLAWPDFSVSYISAIERGQIHPSLRALEILARRLDLPSTQLLPEHSQDGSSSGASRSDPMNEEALTELALLEAQISILQGEAVQAIAKLE